LNDLKNLSTKEISNQVNSNEELFSEENSELELIEYKVD
jgi:hypothetical protein